MKMPPFDYRRPATLSEAVADLAATSGEGKVLAGGQSLLPVMALRLGTPDTVIDIGRVEGLDRIRPFDGGLEIGATVTQAEVETSSLVAELAPLVHDAVGSIGHRAIRNRGTVCGSMAHADPAAEMPAVAVCLGATLVAASARGERLIDAIDFFTGFLSTDLAEDEILTSVRFPAWPPSAGWSFVELSRRDGDFALVGLAVALHSDPVGRIDDASIVFLGVGASPVRAAASEDAIIGRIPDTAVFDAAADALDLDPPSDAHASSAYRSHVAGVLLRRALSEAADRIPTSDIGPADASEGNQ